MRSERVTIMAPKKPPVTRRPGYKLIFRPFIKKGGKKLYAKAYGLKAWPIWVPE